MTDPFLPFLPDPFLPFSPWATIVASRRAIQVDEVDNNA